MRFIQSFSSVKLKAKVTKNVQSKLTLEKKTKDIHILLRFFVRVK